jgi:hypothetical protein
MHGERFQFSLAAGALSWPAYSRWFRGDNLFGLFRLPQPGFVAKAPREQVETLHPLAALHACAALWHQYWRRDGVLGRMIPALRPRATGVRRWRG